MAIKHTHPDYPTKEEREEKLLEAKQACMATLRLLRGMQQKAGA